MSKSRIFMGCCVGIACGIFAASVFSISRFVLVLWFAAILPVLALSYYFKRSSLALAALFFVFAGCGAWRLRSAMGASEFEPLLGQTASFSGMVVEDPDVRTNRQLVTFSPDGYGQRMLLTLPLSAEARYGDWVLITGKPAAAEAFDDFDYPAYLQRYGIYALVRYPDIIILKNHRGNRIKELLLDIKRGFGRRLQPFFKEPERSLLLGILIGARKTLPQDIVDNFNATGTSHIIAISGFNITIIISGLAFLSRLIGRKWNFFVSGAVVFAFTVITGGSSSVIRAAVMGVLLLVSSNIGRQYRVGPALFFAGCVMLLINPKILVFDAGFQLSFLATMGIVYFVPHFERLTASWPNPLNIKTALLTTCAAILPTAPLLAYAFGTFSVAAPVVNMLVLPVVPLTMLLGFLSIIPWVGSGTAFAAHFFLKYILEVTGFFASLPGSSVPVEIPPWFFGVLCSSVAGLLWAVRHYAEKTAVVEPKQQVW